MSRLSVCILVLIGSLTISTSLAAAGGETPVGLQGTIVFKPTDWRMGKVTWWKDSDGINPGKAGCHIGTDINGKANGRMFGEICLSNDLLIETTPHNDVLHKHENDIGHPTKYSCLVY